MLLFNIVTGKAIGLPNNFLSASKEGGGVLQVKHYLHMLIVYQHIIYLFLAVFINHIKRFAKTLICLSLKMRWKMFLLGYLGHLTAIYVVEEPL